MLKNDKTFHRQLGDKYVISCLINLINYNKEFPFKTYTDIKVPKAKKTFRITISDFDLKYPIYDYEGVKFSVYEIPFIEPNYEEKLKKMKIIDPFKNFNK